MATSNLFDLTDYRGQADRYFPYRNRYDTSDNIIVMDMGSSQVRLGWHRDPEPCLQFKPVLTRTRKEKGKESELLVANDILNLEAFRFNLKTPFDRNVVLQMESAETLLDYGFAHLGLNEQGSQGIGHPIVMTETLANPNFCRGLMNELLFECYSVPKLAYGVDGLFSHYQNCPDDQQFQTGLIISCGFHSIHVIPIIEGQMSEIGLRRINLGGFNLINYLQRALQLKYPHHINNITVSRAEEMLFNHCHIVKEFSEELKKWSDPIFYQQNVHKMQLPFTPAPRAQPVDPEVLKQRRQEMAKRLMEINARKRDEKILVDEHLLKSLQTCLNLFEQGYEEKVKRILAKYNLTAKNAAEVEELMEKTKQNLEKAKSKKRSSVLRESESENDFEQPDSKRNRKSKKRQDMNEEERKEFDEWLKDIRQKREEIISRRESRHLRKQQLAKRRTAASQERMRVISQLAKNSKKDDNFGINDDDWDVYKVIRKDLGDSDSEEEQLQLSQYEDLLKENDPNFTSPEDDEISHDSEEWYQLHMATERIRVPEILFQPSIIGLEQAGISETIEFILKKYSQECQDEMVKNIFLTGSLAKLPGFKERLESDLRRIRPFKSQFRVRAARDPATDAWKGARKLANDANRVARCFFTKADYDEKGAEYFAEHALSNQYIETPELEPVSEAPK